MKILVLGGSGMLGHKLVQRLSVKHRVLTTLRSSRESYQQVYPLPPEDIEEYFDVRETPRLEKLIGERQPDVIINAVGIIKQHEAMNDDSLVRQINTELPKTLSGLAAEYGSRLICISTDCVFNGRQGGYLETDRPDALDLYGRSKAEGEIIDGRALTLRTSIVGRELKGSAGLVEWFLGETGKTVRGFKRAIFSGVPTIVLAGLLEEVIENHQQLEGLYHLAAAPIDKYSLLCLVNEFFDARVKIDLFDDFQIDRSLNGEKFERATGLRAPSWPKMIETMARDAAFYDKIRKALTN